MKILNKFWFFLAVTLLVYENAPGQSQSFFVHGKVSSMATKEPIANAGIRVNNIGKTTTNQNGYFKLLLKKSDVKAELRVERIGYKDGIKEITFDKDTIFVNLFLEESVQVLDSVTFCLSTEPDVLVYIPEYDILDFVLRKDKVVVLATKNENENSEIFLVDRSGKILDKIIVPEDLGKSRFLMNDYLGYVSLVCDQSLMRIGIGENRLLNLNADIFMQYAYLKPVVDTSSHTLLFTDFLPYYNNLSYYFFDTKTKKQIKITTLGKVTEKDSDYVMNYRKPDSLDVMDRAGLDIPYFNRNKTLDLSTVMPDGSAGAKAVVHFGMQGNGEWLAKYFKNHLFNPAPAFFIQDTVYVFDLPGKRLAQFSAEGKTILASKLETASKKEWQQWEDVLVKDPIENKVYGLFKKSGKKYLKLVDHKTGNIKGRFDLKGRFPQNIVVYNGYAYYTSRKSKDVNIKTIYKEPIIIKPEK